MCRPHVTAHEGAMTSEWTKLLCAVAKPENSGPDTPPRRQAPWWDATRLVPKSTTRPLSSCHSGKPGRATTGNRCEPVHACAGRYPPESAGQDPAPCPRAQGRGVASGHLGGSVLLAVSRCVGQIGIAQFFVEVGQLQLDLRAAGERWRSAVSSWITASSCLPIRARIVPKVSWISG